ncbi:MAG: RDD family protein [Pseudomonadota bacterium]
MKISQSTSPTEYQTPGMLRIIAAMVYDSLLLAAVSIAYGAIVVGLRVLIQGQPEVGQRIQWNIVSGSLITLGWLAMLVLFYMYFWHRFGQTLAMKTWRFKMVDAQTNQPANYQQCALRSLAAILSLLLLGFGYWCRFFHPQKRMLHDVLSGTKLILLQK